MAVVSAEEASRDRVMQDRDDVYRRVTWRIIPFIFVCYVVNQIDRTNIAFAKLQFMNDLGLTDAAYGLGAGLFFVGYLLFEVPSNLLLSSIGARKTFARILCLWGIASMATALIQSQAQLYFVRFLLGVAEAGFFPGIIYYLAMWYPTRWRARMLSMFVIAIPVAGIIGSPLSGWIMQEMAGIAGLKGWQWLFVLEGIPAVLLGLAAPFALVDAPDQARWLTDRQREQIHRDLELESDSATAVRRHHSIVEALREPKVYLISLAYFAIIMATNAVALWGPTLIKECGIRDIATVGLLAALVWLAAGIGTYLIGASSDALFERRWHVASAMVLTAGAFVAFEWTAGQPILLVLVLAVAASAIYAAVAVFWTIPTSFLDGPAAAGGIAFISSIGAIGGFLSPSILGWAKTETGSLNLGFDAIGVVLCVGAAIILVKMPATKRVAMN